MEPTATAELRVEAQSSPVAPYAPIGLDVWVALGNHSNDYAYWLERLGWADLWAHLIASVKGAAMTPCKCGHRYTPCSCFYEEVRDHNLMRIGHEPDRRKQHAIQRRIDGAAAAAERLRRLGS